LRGFNLIAEKHRDPSNKVLARLSVSPENASMKLIKRMASVLWKGGASGGNRSVTTRSGLVKQFKFSPSAALTNDADTDPAEWIAAAHASSYSWALANELGSRAFTAGEIGTTATVTLKHFAAGWTITGIHLDVVVRLPKLTQAKFIDAALRAKTNCLVSRVLRVNISMNAKLEK
jgi:osmotically inducible protein OsmC